MLKRLVRAWYPERFPLLDHWTPHSGYAEVKLVLSLTFMECLKLLISRRMTIVAAVNIPNSETPGSYHESRIAACGDFCIQAPRWTDPPTLKDIHDASQT